jgi:hypothetical protein
MFDLRGFIVRFTGKRFLKRLEDEETEEFLKGLLRLMKLAFWLDPGYRRNIENFTGSYRFKDKDGGVNVLVRFHNGTMKISEDPVPEVNVMVTFKNSQALMRLLLSLKKDILNSLLNNEVLVTGNLNYLYKFVFMANHPIHPLLNMANKLS